MLEEEGANGIGERGMMGRRTIRMLSYIDVCMYLPCWLYSSDVVREGICLLVITVDKVFVRDRG